MGRSYSADLRDRISGHVSAGHLRRDAARQSGVSASCPITLVQRVEKLDSAASVRRGDHPERPSLPRIFRC